MKLRESITLKYVFLVALLIMLTTALSLYVLYRLNLKKFERNASVELSNLVNFVEIQLRDQLRAIERIQKRLFNLGHIGAEDEIKKVFFHDDRLIKLIIGSGNRSISLEKLSIHPVNLPTNGCDIELLGGKFTLYCSYHSMAERDFIVSFWDIMNAFDDLLILSATYNNYIVVTDPKGKILFSSRISDISRVFEGNLESYIVVKSTKEVPLLGSVNIYAGKPITSFASFEKSLKIIYFVVLGSCIIVSFLFYFLVETRIENQLTPIVDAISHLSQENYGVRVKNLGKLKGEFRYIGGILNRMAERIQEHYNRVAHIVEIFRNLHESIIETDEKGIVKYANRTTLKLFGYSRDELYGSSILNLYKGDAPIRFSNNKVMEQGKPIVVEPVEMVKKNGEVIMCRQTISTSMRGEELRYIFLTIEITEKFQLLRELEERKKELEKRNEELEALTDELQIQAEELEANSEELKVMNEELQEKTRHLEALTYELETALKEKEKLYKQLIRDEKMKTLGMMASGIVHNFSNILTVIIGNAEILQGVLDDKNVNMRLEKIKRAAEGGLETIRRLSDFAKFKELPEKEKIDLREIINDAFDLSRPIWEDRMRRKGVTINIVKDFCEEPAYIMGNPGEIKELFINLITNSVDAMPYGGSIKVSVDKEGKNIVVKFTDTGVGIPEEIRDKVFDPFFTTKGTRGTGLGLSTVYWTVENHGGSIDIYSEEGSGTTFVIKFPVAEGEA